MRRNWFVAAIVIGVASIVIAAIAMRLSDDDEPQSTEAWAGSVCSSLLDWRESIASLADVSSESVTAESLGARLDSAEDATSDLVSELRALGPPDLETGDDVKAQLDDSVDELEASFESLKASAEEAADASAEEFLAALAGLSSEFDELQATVSGTIVTLQGADVAGESRAELQEAFAAAPSCQQFEAES